jgi:hypothetical protein
MNMAFERIASRSTQPHKFFERFLDNDLTALTTLLQDRYEKINRGEIVKGELNTDGAFSESNSITTMNWHLYNTFQFYHPTLHNLAKAVKEMTLEACEYYSIDFDSQNFMVQSWFNINYAKKGKLDFHEHGGNGAPHFHGYYCVSAEPSITHYQIFNKETVDNHNKNNRAILSETGHRHAMADWDWEGPRITIAYDVLPLNTLLKVGALEQHWFPLV